MRIEAPEVKREDGSKLKIVIEVIEQHYSTLSWRLADVETKEPRKRTWVSHADKIERSFQYRGIPYDERYKIPYDERFKIKQQELLDLVGEEEVKKAFQYAYDYIKPDILKEVSND
jgi:hypothetical protein